MGRFLQMGAIQPAMGGREAAVLFALLLLKSPVVAK
jgi:hypothetical protein